MKLFSRKSTDQKKRAQARNAMKKLKKGIVAEMEELNKEMESVKAEYEELFGEIQKVVALMDKEIEDAKAEGLDTSEMEKNLNAGHKTPSLVGYQATLWPLAQLRMHM
ncbi:MAG: hypothetical protein ACE14P_06200 [Methanotrichaceae archaeon]